MRKKIKNVLNENDCCAVSDNTDDTEQFILFIRTKYKQGIIKAGSERRQIVGTSSNFSHLKVRVFMKLWS